MPTYEAGSRPDNIMKSVNNWIDANIRVGLGLTVYYEGQGRLGTLPITWVESFLIFGDYVDNIKLAGTADRFATWMELFLNLNVFRKMDSGSTGLTAIYDLATTSSNIAQLFGGAMSIPLYDYDTVGEPQDGSLSVMNTPIPKAIATPVEMGVEQRNISVQLRQHSVVAH